MTRCYTFRFAHHHASPQVLHLHLQGLTLLVVKITPIHGPGPDSPLHLCELTLESTWSQAIGFYNLMLSEGQIAPLHTI